MLPLPTTESIDLSVTEIEALRTFEQFAFDFFDAANGLSVDKNGNLSISPISATLCFALYANSIDEPQRDNVAKLLGFDNVESMNTLATKLLQYLPSPTNGADLKIANSVWYSDKYEVSESYRGLMSKNFGASVNAIDMNNEGSVDIINHWCSKNTNGMIPSIIERLNYGTLAVWVNAVYFAGAWKNPFEKSLTTQTRFNGTDGSYVVPMMNGSLLTDYSEKDGNTMLSLPFKGFNYMIDIIMGDGTFDNSLYTALKTNVQTVKAEIALPKFSLASDLNLTDVFPGLGLNTEDATFTSMGLPDTLIQSNIKSKQKTAISIDEEGAAISAVTYIGTETSTGQPIEYPNVKFTVDRPFHFIVRNTITDAIILMGRVNNLPNAN